MILMKFLPQVKYSSTNAWCPLYTGSQRLAIWLCGTHGLCHTYSIKTQKQQLIIHKSKSRLVLQWHLIYRYWNLNSYNFHVDQNILPLIFSNHLKMQTHPQQGGQTRTRREASPGCRSESSAVEEHSQNQTQEVSKLRISGPSCRRHDGGNRLHPPPSIPALPGRPS